MKLMMILFSRLNKKQSPNSELKINKFYIKSGLEKNIPNTFYECDRTN